MRKCQSKNQELQPASRFSVMASLAEWLPVRLIPEQLLIAPVRNDVVYHCGRSEPALSLAHDAQGMPL